MNRKISLGVAIALMSLAAAVAIVITAGYSMYDFNGRMQSLRESEVMYSKLNEIDGYVRQNFYGDIDEEELMNAVSKGYVSGLASAPEYKVPETLPTTGEIDVAGSTSVQPLMTKLAEAYTELLNAALAETTEEAE